MWPPSGVPVVRVTPGEFVSMVHDAGTVYAIAEGFVRGADGRLYPMEGEGV